MSLKVLIFEDEALSAEHLEKLIRQYDPSIELLGTIESLKQGQKWLESNQRPDLMIMDIQLSDGSSFELFSQFSIETPVIFTTAYNEYAIQAFKVNSIDYLLKPINLHELKEAFEKFKKRNLLSLTSSAQKYEQIYTLLSQSSRYKSRFLIKIGEQLKYVNFEDVAYFKVEEGMSHAITFSGNKYPLDHSLDEVENILDPQLFFRINRQFIVKLKSIEKIHSYFNGRLKLNLNPASNSEVIISRERVADFKNWLDS